MYAARARLTPADLWMTLQNVHNEVLARELQRYRDAGYGVCMCACVCQ
jgi:hypothetical protein